MLRWLFCAGYVCSIVAPNTGRAADYFGCEFYDNSSLWTTIFPVFETYGERSDRADEDGVKRRCLDYLRSVTAESTGVVACAARFHGHIFSQAGSHSLNKSVQSSDLAIAANSVDECWWNIVAMLDKKIRTDKKISTGRFTGRRDAYRDFTPESVYVFARVGEVGSLFWVQPYRD